MIHFYSTGHFSIIAIYFLHHQIITLWATFVVINHEDNAEWIFIYHFDSVSTPPQEKEHFILSSGSSLIIYLYRRRINIFLSFRGCVLSRPWRINKLYFFPAKKICNFSQPAQIIFFSKINNRKRFDETTPNRGVLVDTIMTSDNRWGIFGTVTPSIWSQEKLCLSYMLSCCLEHVFLYFPTHH